MRPSPVPALGLVTLLQDGPIPAAARSAMPAASPPVAAPSLGAFGPNATATFTR